MLERAPSGTRMLKDLTDNDSWIRRTYIEIGKAKREVDRFPFNFKDVVGRANKLQADVVSLLPDSDAKARAVDPDKVASLINFLSEGNGGLIIMRHGIQFVEDEERDRLAGSQRKIRLMQLPHNDLDPASAQSLAEAASLGLIFKHIRESMEMPLKIRTSKNVRAADVAAAISVANNFDIQTDSRLTCVNYPAEKTDEELEGLLGRDNNGALVWRKEVLDSVCGDGTFRTIDKDMRSVVGDFGFRNGLTICVTHTPQMNAADVVVGQTPMRVPELGFRVINRKGTLQFSSNVFKEAA